MSDSLSDRDIQALTISANENFAHARDHEHLRGQVTSILVAASSVLVGITISELSGFAYFIIAALVILIGILNVRIVQIHNNRFDWHVSIARCAKSQISPIKAKASVETIRGLSRIWLAIATLPIFAGISLFVLGVLDTCW